MDYVLQNWGSFIGLIGVGVSIGGLIASLVAVYRAGKARDAAAAAEIASNDTQVEITKVLAIVDLERAIGLIERLKAFHRNSQWEAAIGHYPDLQYMLTNILIRHPNPTEELRTTLSAALTKLKVIETNVDRAIRNRNTPRGSNNFNNDLADIESDLRRIASSTQFSGSKVDE